jgi:N-methylhydantoinase A
MKTQSIRLGVDIGGTFTDAVLEVGKSQFSTKVLTTYAVPEDAIVEAVKIVCAKAEVLPSQITQIIHGTTLATNALIERRGAKTALITTQGFRDVIEMRTESRFEQYDLNLVLPEPLLPRQNRFTVSERVSAKGDVLIPLNREEVEKVVDEIGAAGYTSVAVGLIHSYANESHEKTIGEVLRDRLPETMVSLSSEVSPQMREYERFNTTVANAYIKPLMKSYLSRLGAKLGLEGIACKIFLMHSGGGIISIDSAAEYPVRLVESGPAGGAVFAATIAKRFGLKKVLSFDMGGTTAKICLIKNQSPKTSRVFEVARTYRFKKGSGMPISIPVIDMVEIGAGGGSLAHVDAMQQIRVGPESAGSEPGPACYNRGGARPAVTDADLVLGRLDADNFAGGSMKLDPDLAKRALESELGNALDTNAQTAAYGLSEVVDENMANAARVHAVENGEDLSQYTMIAFGGAAPLHAGRLCEKLGIASMLVPQGAGVGSAIGFLRAPFSFEANRSVYMNLSKFAPDAVEKLLGELKKDATAFVRTCDAKAKIQSEYKVYMRYKGQGWEIPVGLSEKLALAPKAESFKALFEKNYANLFGRNVEGMEIEITVWSVCAATPNVKIAEAKKVRKAKAFRSLKSRTFFDAALERNVKAAVVQRNTLKAGQTIVGPAIITEDETTIIVPTSRIAITLADGTIDVRQKV